MRFYLPFTFVLISIALAACQSDAVRLRNPQTGEIAQCGPYGQMSSKTAAATREQCVNEYQQKGYQRVTN